MAKRVRVVHCLVWWIVAAAACGAPSVEPTAGRLAPATVETPLASAPGPRASSAASAQGSLSALPAAPKPLPVRSATPGKVQCETVDCDLATEVCCVDEAAMIGRCVPKGSAEAAACKPDELSRACDEAADCGANGHCCHEISRDDECLASERWACDPAGCSGGGDPSSELCLPGSSCTRGACRATEATEGWPREGLCPADFPPVACGSKTCAPGEACCWDSKGKKGSCVKDGEGCDPDYARGAGKKLFSCRSPKDCGPNGECFASTGNAMLHEYACGTSRCNPMIGILGPYLCDKRDDCAPSITVIASETTDATYQLTGCGPDPEYPPGVKVCHYK